MNTQSDSSFFRRHLSFGSGIATIPRLLAVAALLAGTALATVASADENLLTRGDFDDTEIGDTPRSWLVLNDDVWDVMVVDGGITSGGKAVSGRRTGLGDDASIRQHFTGGLKPDQAYEFSIMARSPDPGATIRLRYQVTVDGSRFRYTQSFNLSDEYRRYRLPFATPLDNGELPADEWRHFFPVTFGGVNDFDELEILVDDAVLQEIDSLEEDGLQAANYDPDPDPVQGLTAFMERAGSKPYELFETEDGFRTQRLIFRDRVYGTPVWMIDDSPVVDSNPSASVWSQWDTKGSRLHLRGFRPWDGSIHNGWLANSDFSLLEPATTGRMIWDPSRPDTYYRHGGGDLRRGNALTGEEEVIARWDSYPRERVYGLTADNRYIIVDTPNGGQWVPYNPDEEIPTYSLHAGRPALPDEDYTYWRNGKRYIGEHPDYGHLFRIRVSTRIDVETGEMTRVVVPLSGSRFYLDTFANGDVDFTAIPDYDESNFEMPGTDDLDELFELYRYYPVSTHGHESPSPDFHFKAADGETIEVFDVRNVGTLLNISLGSDGRNYHLHWERHPRFLVGWLRGWLIDGSFRRPHNANLIYQFFTDGTKQPIFDGKHRLNTSRAGDDFSMQSPDATKIHTASSMTGRIRNYIAVMARPRPPENVSWAASETEINLTWDAPLLHDEIRGYLVYRSTRSGDGYELVTHEPVGDTSWRDESVEPGQAYYYVVTSLEHSGLESGYSNEAARVGIEVPIDLNDPLVVYAEPENAVKDLYTDEMPGLAMGADRWEASDWYYLYRHPDIEEGEAAMPLQIPAEGDYHVWARVRSSGDNAIHWGIELTTTGAPQEDWLWDPRTNRWTAVSPEENDPTETTKTALEAVTDRDSWTWVRAGGDPVRLDAGSADVRFTTSDADAQIDLIVLATDSGFQPEGPRPEKTTPPEPPSSLVAENVRDRTNRLTWTAAEDPTFSHYNVYASREAIDEVSQSLLRGSPTYGELIDWGLRADTRYYYAVTVVDRRGNESSPAFTQATTPARETPEHMIELAFADGELEGSFEQANAGGLRGSAFVVPREPDNNRVAWEIDVPEAGNYYYWLRYLPRNDGVRQEVRAYLNGDLVTVLGARGTGRAGDTDFHLPDEMIEEGQPLADRAWTWMNQGRSENIEAIHLPEGRHTLTLDNLRGEIRYDILLLTNEPSFTIPDGRKKMNF